MHAYVAFRHPFTALQKHGERDGVFYSTHEWPKALFILVYTVYAVIAGVSQAIVFYFNVVAMNIQYIHWSLF